MLARLGYPVASDACCDLPSPQRQRLTCQCTVSTRLPRTGTAQERAAFRRVHAEVRPGQPVLLQCRAVRFGHRAGRSRPRLRARGDRIPASRSTCCSVRPTRALRWPPRRRCAARDHGRDVPFAFNRKEAKAHGEGGLLIGAPLKGRVLIVDDVITAGTAIRESLALIRAHGAHAGRRADCARSPGTRRRARCPPRRKCTAEFGIPVIAVARLDDLLALVDERPNCRLIAPHCRPTACATESPHESCACDIGPSHILDSELVEVRMRSITANMAALLLTIGHRASPQSRSRATCRGTSSIAGRTRREICTTPIR